MKFNKLVRDKIPEIILANGDTPISHIATDLEYKQYLKKKLQEELDEFLEHEDVVELADLLEVIYATGTLLGTDKEALELIRKEKALKRGGFIQKIILEETN